MIVDILPAMRGTSTSTKENRTTSRADSRTPPLFCERCAFEAPANDPARAPGFAFETWNQYDASAKLMFLETAAWPHMREARAKINEQARTGYSKCNAYSQGIYLAWTSKLDLYLEAIESIFVQSKSGKVVNDITDILRANDW